MFCGSLLLLTTKAAEGSGAVGRERATDLIPFECQHRKVVGLLLWPDVPSAPLSYSPLWLVYQLTQLVIRVEGDPIEEMTP